MDTRDSISEREIVDRLVFALLLPAVRLARRHRVPLKRMKRWIETAYYREVQTDEMTIREVADRLDVSTSKVSLLSRQFKENFAGGDAELALSRRIEFMLWAEPLSLARLKQVLTDVEDAEIERVVDQLLDDDRLRADESGRQTVFELNLQADRRTWDSWLARIDGLDNLLANLADTVYGRFFAEEPATFARTLTFRLRPEALDRLRTFYEEELFGLVRQLDAETEEDEEAQSLSLSVLWAPYRYLVDQKWDDS